MTITELERSKEKFGKSTVIFIFYDESNNLILLEKRKKPGSYFDGKIFPPGGAVEDFEMNNITIALKREIKEETGIDSFQYERIPSEDIYGETGYLLIPYLIRNWQGEIPSKVLDTDSPLVWISVDGYIPELESVRKITDAFKAFVKK